VTLFLRRRDIGAQEEDGRGSKEDREQADSSGDR